MRDKSLLDNIKNYKGTLVGQDHNLFKGLMVCKVSGVTFDNRQEALREVVNDTAVRVVRDRHNKFDFHAVVVQAFVEEEWKDVGFVPSNINKEVAQAMDAGISFTAKVWRKTGGEGDFHHGLSVTIKRKE